MVHCFVTKLRREFNGRKKESFQQMVLGLDINMQKNKYGAFPHTVHKTILEMYHWSNLRANTIKSVQEAIAVNLCDLGLASGFLDITPKAQVMTGKVAKLVFIKRELTEWEKVFASHISDSGLIKRQLTQWKGAKDLNIFARKIHKWKTSSCEDIQHH